MSGDKMHIPRGKSNGIITFHDIPLTEVKQSETVIGLVIE